MKKLFIAFGVGLASVGLITGTGVASARLEPLVTTEEDDGAVIRQIPSSLRVACKGNDRAVAAKGVVAAATCRPRKDAVQKVVYAQFESRERAEVYYRRERKKDKIPTDTYSDCKAYDDSESPYRTDNGDVGRVFCTSRRHEESITWTYDRVVAKAVASGRAADDVEVYQWWERLVGRTLNPTQQVLLSQVTPGGVPRDNCGDNGDASIKCTDPVEKVDVARYTQYQGGAELASAYDGILSKAQLGRDSPPPTDKDTCSFETYWGLMSGDTITQQLGRVACIEDAGIYRVVWTDNRNAVLTESEGEDLTAALDFFRQYGRPTQPETTGQPA